MVVYHSGVALENEGNRNRAIVGLAVAVALCGRILVLGSRGALSIQSLTYDIRFSGRTSLIAASPETSTTTFQMSQKSTNSDSLEDHSRANFLFGVAYFAVLLSLTPSSQRRSEGTQDVLSESETSTQLVKPKILVFEGLRFFLMVYIVSGHFIMFATKSNLIRKVVSQINVVVGGFFVISGYVAAYTTTELGKRKYIAARLDDAINFTTSRIMAFVPLHFLVLAVFGAMFFWTDFERDGPLAAISHGIMTTTLTQAWFPLSAEVWNAPTWFLSALSFCLMVLPYALKVMAPMTKQRLRRTLAFLTIASVVPKLAYSYSLNAWTIFEGMLNFRSHPSYAFFNVLRFNPLFALLEVLMGAAACRLVMLDTEMDTCGTGSSLVPLVAMLSIIILRANDVIALNDMLVRGFLFIPLFIVFLMRSHRESIYRRGNLANVLKLFNTSLFVYLGGLSFPIFVVHGPIGQFFYKKNVATRLWGGTLNEVIGEWFFGVYWLVLITVAFACQKFFLESSTVAMYSKTIATSLNTVTRRMDWKAAEAASRPPQLDA